MFVTYSNAAMKHTVKTMMSEPFINSNLVSKYIDLLFDV